MTSQRTKTQTPEKITKNLLLWFYKHKREMPWRTTQDAYRIWVSEVMLQQTQVEQVRPYYQRFMVAFPDILTLANAKLDEVYKLWEGLGYYRRAALLHKAAQIVVTQYQGRIPDQYEFARSLPGFGDYTIGAVLSIAYQKKLPAIDGNVIRVMSRLYRIESEVHLSATKRQIESLVQSMIPDENPGDFNQALMELGALICTPQSPQCTRCPVHRFCKSYNELPNPNILPNKKKKTIKPHMHIAAGIVFKNKRILAAKRPSDVILGNLWEFPGGKKESGESLLKTCERELQNKIGIRAKIGKCFLVHKHAYSHYTITLHFYKCDYIGGQPIKRKHSALRWVYPKKALELAWATSHRKALEKLLKDAIY
ncbi:MAG TPA: A/G-specific adenine glycosylase [bacterium]|nr:A/G-specific adenine glycosylase [bacterium]HMZ04223.1 A/G-specific adenine glycosylase [bacterium]HNB10292.1 A/G-specific adenine glycosylase [bacterium]HNC50340.1 A/G-specific adenine glycosylase [bacterium]HND76006.1 A/G-specific adenine glycosylase [bacterium]